MQRNKKYTEGEVKKVSLSKCVFESLKATWGTTWTFLCGWLWGMITVREGYISAEFAAYGHQMCYCDVESIGVRGEAGGTDL